MFGPSLYPRSVQRLILFSRSYHNHLCHTSVFVQNGTKISELPVTVQKVLNYKTTCDTPPPTAITYLFDSEMTNGFKRCASVAAIFSLIETMPSEDVTPSVAVHALRRLAELDSESEAFRTRNIQTNGPEHYSFTKRALVNRLFDIVCNCREPQIILEAVDMLSKHHFPLDQDQYCSRIVEATMLSMAERRFNLSDLCSIAPLLNALCQVTRKPNEPNMADQLWTGIIDKSSVDSEWNSLSLRQVFGVLPHLKSSRRIIQALVEERLAMHWQTCDTKCVLDILVICIRLGLLGSAGFNILVVVSKWLSVNIQSLKELEFLAVILCLKELEYIDDCIINTIEKYIKIRGCQIHEKDVVCALCDYIFEFRVRSLAILEGASEYFMQHGSSMSATQMFKMVRIFGYLDYHPPNGFRFWEFIEHQIEMKFAQFSPVEFIELLVSFICIQRYPLNFVKKIFNPYFMDRVNKQTEKDITKSRRQIHLLDSCLKLECGTYDDPHMPKMSKESRPSLDNRQDRLASELLGPLADAVAGGDIRRVLKSVFLNALPPLQNYVVDLVVYPSSAATSIMRLGFLSHNFGALAVLLHPRQHYDRNRKHLLGLQVMRGRQLLLMGFKVMHIEADLVKQFRRHPQQLHNYLVDQFKRQTQKRE